MRSLDRRHGVGKYYPRNAPIENPMYCAHCGIELPGGATTCASCSFRTQAPSPAASGHASSNPVDEILRETKQAVRDLAEATAKLSKRLAAHADAAAKDPSATARRARDRLKKDIDALATDVSNTLKKL